MTSDEKIENPRDGVSLNLIYLFCSLYSVSKKKYYNFYLIHLLYIIKKKIVAKLPDKQDLQTDHKLSPIRLVALLGMDFDAPLS